jgi:hypothetical protein
VSADVDPERSEVHLRWARASMEVTIEALGAALPASDAEARDLGWALAVARRRLAHLGLALPA